jgi:DNA repair protein RadC
VITSQTSPYHESPASGDDEITTRGVAPALKAVGITLSDHIIVADGDFVSMAQNGSI